jgi:hypothetical protein
VATKLKPERPDSKNPGKTLPAQQVVRDVHGYLVRVTLRGLYIRKSGTRLEIGPFDFGVLYQDGVQRAQGLAPVKPRKPVRKGAIAVSRGLLQTERGR